MNWKDLKIIVTGGSGFIGSHLVDMLLELGAEVIIFDSRKPKFGNYQDAYFVKGDITNKIQVDNAIDGCDIIFHLAGLLGTHELIRQIPEAIDTNCMGTLNVILACLKNKKKPKMVLISKPNIWLNIYSVTKEFSERAVATYQENFDLEAVVIKLPTVFGERQPLESEAGYKKAIPTWITSGLKGETIEIFGKGNHRIHLLYVKDAVDAILTVIKMEAWRTLFRYTNFQIDSNVVLKTKELARIIKKETGNLSQITYKPMPHGEDAYHFVKTYPQKIKVTWPSRIRFKQNLKKTIEWYKQN